MRYRLLRIEMLVFNLVWISKYVPTSPQHRKFENRDFIKAYYWFERSEKVEWGQTPRNDPSSVYIKPSYEQTWECCVFSCHTYIFPGRIIYKKPQGNEGCLTPLGLCKACLSLFFLLSVSTENYQSKLRRRKWAWSCCDGEQQSNIAQSWLPPSPTYLQNTTLQATTLLCRENGGLVEPPT